MTEILALWAAGAAAVGALAPRVRRRLALSRAKHRSLAGHARLATRLARIVRYYGHDAPQIWSVDGAPGEVAARREAAFARLSDALAVRAPRTIALTERAERSISDLQFTGAYRVPFPFSRYVARRLKLGAFAASAEGVTITDLDGNRYYDLGGAYGANVLGIDAYRQCIAEGAARVQALGPVLGAYHPLVATNAERLCALSGMDEVSFHMSGTEAVMQAVRLARYHTGRTHVVRFCGAYHGWWEDVQPGPGNPSPPRETYTLADMSERSLRVLRERRDIACVLVNPLQALHPNASGPTDGALVGSRSVTSAERAAYAAWLARVRDACTERGIVLVFDEVFAGFRLARGGAQEYYGVRPDLVTYGKNVGGGMPVGVVCGRAPLMRRYDDARPANVCFARGTFNSHPYVMGAMAAFLDRLDSAPVRALYEGLDARWDARAQRLNARLAAAGVPVQVANLSSVWTVRYTAPGRYHWLLQYYLRERGIALGWIGTGRLVFSLDWRDEDFDAMCDRFVEAAESMKSDGWWWNDGSLTDRSLRRRLLLESLRARASWGR